MYTNNNNRSYQLNIPYPNFDMGDIVPEHRQDGQIGLVAPADDYVPQKCTFTGCKEVQVFPTKASLKYPNRLPI
jgi:hypothetical protein